MDGPLAAGFAVAAGATVVFAKLLDAIDENDRMVRIDRDASRWIADRRSGVVGAMRAVTRLGDPLVVAGVVAVATLALLIRRHRGAAVFMVVSSAGTALLVALAKLVIARPRPPGPVAGLSISGSAFPSGHAAQSIACYGALAVVVATVSRRGLVDVVAAMSAAMVALTVGLSRVTLGVHWLSDVVAGWALAAGWLALLLTGRRALLRYDHGPPEPPDPS